MRSLILAICLLAFGTFSSLSSKWQSSTYAEGFNGEQKRFEHPGVQTLCMFIGMSLNFVFYLCRVAFFSKKLPRENLWETVLLVPTTLDLLQNALAVVGLLWIPVSVWQMLNGAIVVFGAIFSVVILKRKMTALRWLAIFFATLGLALVGASGLLNKAVGSGISAKFVVGLAVVFGAQIVGSLHMISEEKLMSFKTPFDPDHLAGIQGVNGMVLTILLLPVLYLIPLGDGRLDDGLEAIVQLSNSLTLTLLVALYIICSTVFNYTSLAIAVELSTIHRTLVDSCRTIFVWLVSIVIYYCDNTQYGEGWQGWSWMQLVGFVVLLSSTLAYNFLPSPDDQHPQHPVAVTELTPSINADTQVLIDEKMVLLPVTQV